MKSFVDRLAQCFKNRPATAAVVVLVAATVAWGWISRVMPRGRGPDARNVARVAGVDGKDSDARRGKTDGSADQKGEASEARPVPIERMSRAEVADLMRHRLRQVEAAKAPPSVVARMKEFVARAEAAAAEEATRGTEKSGERSTEQAGAGAAVTVGGAGE